MTEYAAISAVAVLIVFAVIAVWPKKEPEEHPLVKEWKDGK